MKKRKKGRRKKKSMQSDCMFLSETSAPKATEIVRIRKATSPSSFDDQIIEKRKASFFSRIQTGHGSLEKKC